MTDVVYVEKTGMAGAAGIAVAALAAGKVVILPSDTVYGLTAAVFQMGDISRMRAGGVVPLWQQPAAELYRIKGRRVSQPSIILARDWETAALIGTRMDAAERFCRKVQSSITVIVPAKRPWGPPATDHRGGIALRIPQAGFMNLVLKFAKFAFSVSANRPGGKDPLEFVEVPAEIKAAVPVAVDGGPSPSRQPSNIVDFTTTPPQVVRGDAALAEALATFRL